MPAAARSILCSRVSAWTGAFVRDAISSALSASVIFFFFKCGTIYIHWHYYFTYMVKILIKSYLKVILLTIKTLIQRYCTTNNIL